VVKLAGVRVGISICEDIWYPVGPTRVSRALRVLAAPARKQGSHARRRLEFYQRGPLVPLAIGPGPYVRCSRDAGVLTRVLSVV